MNLLKSKLSLAIATGLLSGSAFAAPIICSITPANSIITDGQVLQLTAACDAKLASISWKIGNTLVAEDAALSSLGAATYHYTTPIGLASSSVGQEFVFSAAGTGGEVTFSNTARVVVKPSSAVIAVAFGNTTTPTTPVDAACGTLTNGKTVPAMPTTNQCDSGKVALAVSSPPGFTWSCLSLTGGAEDSCYAMRQGYVAPTTTTTTAPTTTTTTTTTTAPTTTTTAPTTTTSTSSDDPSSGLWVPPNTTNRVVADQSGTVQSKTSYVPGCLNGSYITTASGSGCGGKASYTGTISGTNYTFAFGSGKVLSLRYQSKSTAGTSVKYFTLSSGDGGNVGQSVKVWLSTNPAATYDATSAACKLTSTTQPYVLTGPGYCPVTPNQPYYLSMSIDTACTNCRYIVEEGASDFQ